MRWFGNVFLIIVLSVFIVSCEDNTPKHEDTLGKGTIDISADETYQPILEEQLKVFDSIYPEAHITIHYKPEAECFKDYFDKKARIILVTRELTKPEKDVCEQQKIWPTSMSLARDGIAVLVNNESADSILAMPTLKGILTGVYKKKYTVVFDNQNSSTLRYITDSLLRGEKLGANVFAAKSNNEVIDYVSKNPDAIGFVGMSYVYVNEDTSRAGMFIQKVKVVSMQNDTDRKFYRPYQAYVALRSYPLSRNLYYINSESHHGLGTGFANFLAGQRGQLIFLHAHLFPLRANLVIRDVKINDQ
jgi:phosphate transport system substrate-binding protein